MLRKSIAAVALMLPGLLIQPAVAGAPAPPATQWLPASTPIVVELSRPDAFLDLVLDPKMADKITSLPAYEELASQPGFQQFTNLIEFLELRLGTDWRMGLRKLVGGGVTFAVGPKESVLLMIDAKDAKMLGELNEIIVGFAREEAEKQGNPGRVGSAEYRGVTAWTLGPNQAHAVIGNRLLVTNKPDALKAVVDLREDAAAKRLAGLPAYQAAKKAAGPDAVATAYVNLEILKQVPGVEKALDSEKNPLAALVFAGVTEAVRQSTWLGIGLKIDGETLRLEAAVDGKLTDPAGPAAFAQPAEPTGGALPHLAVPGRIAGMSLYRDLHGFYAAKDDLFPERSSGLILFENMMGIFFSGRDLTEEVLAEAQPEVRVVVAEQKYDPAVGTPVVKIPGFALVLRLRHPEEFNLIMEEAWQKAVGLTSFTRGQQALPGLIIDRFTHGDTKYTVAYFSPAEVEDREHLETRFNFRPALAMLDDYLILSSAEGLARDLIDATKKEFAATIEPLAAVHSSVRLDGRRLASILGTNREQLVRHNMIEEGNTQEEAETEIDLLMTLVQYLGSVKLDVGSRDGNTQASLELELNVADQ